MTGITVQGVALDAGQNPAPFATIHIALVTSSSSTPGYTGSGEIIESFQTSASQTGTWSATLTPNAGITPANTYYQVTEGPGAVSNIVVPASGGPYQIASLLVTPPPTPAAPGITGLQVAAAGTVAGVRPELNLIAGSGAAITAADNPSANRVDVTLTTSPNTPTPADHGYIAWAFDPANIIGTSALTVGALYLTAMYIRAATTITDIALAYGTTAGAGLSNCYVGLYDSNGNLLSGSADQSTAWATSAGSSGGPKTTALTTPQSVAAGYYWAAFMIGGAGTNPVWGRGGNNPIGFMNIGLGLNTRFGELSTASTPAAPFTALPASFTPATANIAIPGAPFWAAVK